MLTKLAKNLEITILLDFYGDMLTTKQREFLDYYYNEDLSLAEIAANVGITRQGVRDAIKRAECQLIEMEQRLGLVDRFKDVQSGLEEIIECASKISAENRKTGLSREINDLSVRIKSIALSGRYLSAIYLEDSCTAELIASSVIFTLWCAS